MCHGLASKAFPELGEFRVSTASVTASVFGNDGKRIAILPDIYGSNPFYQGLATRWAESGAEVHLIDVFAGLGDLPRATREAAFSRRHRLRDSEFLDRFESYVREHEFHGVVGFCLGGLFVFDLARRNVDPELIAFYPFPQGLENQDPLDVPLDYLDGVEKRHTVLVGSEDPALKGRVLDDLSSVAVRNEAIDLHIFDGSAHGFLGDLDDEDDASKRGNASAALAVCEARLGL